MTLAIIYFEDKTSVHIYSTEIKEFHNIPADQRMQAVFEYVAGLAAVSNSSIKSIFYSPTLKP